ncbi:hypothetical protein SAY87_005484 [Trapa incisa]|uniref:Uncharacterized protein n=1 Tax=Trapa incisa TaxID=236973 RepID=A0AAN7Q6J3_9MYRT|nr:hypothetical protein SAY87_005484 [Trapa incisa]
MFHARPVIEPYSPSRNQCTDTGEDITFARCFNCHNGLHCEWTGRDGGCRFWVCRRCPGEDRYLCWKGGDQERYSNGAGYRCLDTAYKRSRPMGGSSHRRVESFKDFIVKLQSIELLVPEIQSMVLRVPPVLLRVCCYGSADDAMALD